MKFTRKRGDVGTIRKVWSDDKEVCFGVVGMVGDLLLAGLLDYADCSPMAWCFIPAPGVMQRTWFGQTRDEALENLPRI